MFPFLSGNESTCLSSRTIFEIAFSVFAIFIVLSFVCLYGGPNSGAHGLSCVYIGSIVTDIRTMVVTDSEGTVCLVNVHKEENIKIMTNVCQGLFEQASRIKNDNTV